MTPTQAARADRNAQIARAVIEQPSRTLRSIAEDFKVDENTVARACKAHQVPTSGRPIVRNSKWGEGAMRTGIWLHTGDILMRNSDGNRQVVILGMVYHDDMTVSYLCKPASDFRKGTTRYIHERTLKISYVRIKTTERKLPDERFLQWTFGLSN